MSNHLLFDRPENIESASNFFFDYLVTVTDGAWPVAITFMFFSIVYLNLSDFNAKKAYAAASFVNLVLTTLLVALGAFSSQALVISILMVIIAVVVNGGGNR